VEADSHTVKFATSKFFEQQRRMGGISFQQSKVLVGEILDPWW
jgi:hypothetical protein